VDRLVIWVSSSRSSSSLNQNIGRIAQKLEAIDVQIDDRASGARQITLHGREDEIEFGFHLRQPRAEFGERCGEGTVFDVLAEGGELGQADLAGSSFEAVSFCAQPVSLAESQGLAHEGPAGTAIRGEGRYQIGD
jgi:hypothetical protein